MDATRASLRYAAGFTKAAGAGAQLTGTVVPAVGGGMDLGELRVRLREFRLQDLRGIKALSVPSRSTR